MSVTPVFVLSLPRSGSTLVQRVLSVHPDVATAAEPWLLLPLVSPLRPAIPWAGSWHPRGAAALQDFAGRLPGGLDAYRAAARDAALSLYTDAAGPGARFFVDKTPPYFLIVDELFDVFPDARFLFLWRNPLSVVASVVETFRGGVWQPDDYAVSLFTGLENLLRAHDRHGDRAVSVRYEDLVAGDAWAATARALGLPFDSSATGAFTGVHLRGRMGDPTGSVRYDAVAREPLDKWRTTIDGPVRRAWCRRYLRWIGRERLAQMGYDLDELLAHLDATAGGRPRGTLDDGLRMARSFARDVVKAQVVREARGQSAWRRLLAG